MAAFPAGKSKRGPDGDPWKPALIRGLYAVYQAAGGRGKLTQRENGYSGPFVNFVHSVLKKLGQRAQPTTVGSQVHAAFKPRRNGKKATRTG